MGRRKKPAVDAKILIMSNITDTKKTFIENRGKEK